MMDGELERTIHKYYWELLTSVHRKQLVSKINIVVLWCHYVLERNGFKNAGLSYDDYTTMPRKREVLEILPDGWHNMIPCQIRYVFQNKLYMLCVNIPDDDGWVLVIFKRARDNKMAFSGMYLHEVQKVKGGLEDVLPNYIGLLDRFNKEIVNPLIIPHSRKYVATPRGIAPQLLNRLGIARLPQDYSSKVNPMGRGAGKVLPPPGIRVKTNLMPPPPVPRGCPVPRKVIFSPAPEPNKTIVRFDMGPNDEPRPGPSGDIPEPYNPAYPGYRMFRKK